MQFTKIVAPSVKELFVRKVESMILSGELAVGDALPSERELAEQMEISKTAVHSGIVEMARKGFLEVVPRRGVFVGDYAKNGTLEALISIMQHNGGRLDARNARSMLEVRCAIEEVAITHVTSQRDFKTLRELQRIADMAQAVAEGPEPVDVIHLAELYFTFHHTLCVASGNTIIPLILNAFRAPAIQLWANSARSLGIQESIARLLRFMELIRSGNVEEARAYMRWIDQTSITAVLS